MRRFSWAVPFGWRVGSKGRGGEGASKQKSTARATCCLSRPVDPAFARTDRARTIGRRSHPRPNRTFLVGSHQITSRLRTRSARWSVPSARGHPAGVVPNEWFQMKAVRRGAIRGARSKPKPARGHARTVTFLAAGRHTLIRSDAGPRISGAPISNCAARGKHRHRPANIPARRTSTRPPVQAAIVSRLTNADSRWRRAIRCAPCASVVM